MSSSCEAIDLDKTHFFMAQARSIMAYRSTQIQIDVQHFQTIADLVWRRCVASKMLIGTRSRTSSCNWAAPAKGPRAISINTCCSPGRHPETLSINTSGKFCVPGDTKRLNHPIKVKQTRRLGMKLTLPAVLIGAVMYTCFHFLLDGVFG